MHYQQPPHVYTLAGCPGYNMYMYSSKMEKHNRTNVCSDLSSLHTITHAVHGFPVVSYNVSEGDTLDTTFGLNVKGNTTRFQALVHRILAQGNVIAERVRASKCLLAHYCSPAART